MDRQREEHLFPLNLRSLIQESPILLISKVHVAKSFKADEQVEMIYK